MIFKSFIHIAHSALQLLNPICLLCGNHAVFANLCHSCRSQLPILSQGCQKCAQHLVGDQLICGDCLKSPPSFDQIVALFHYQPPISQLVSALKYNHQLVYAALFGKLLAQRLVVHYADKKKPDMIIPMPLHPRRLKERGFNQAVEIARDVSRCLNIVINTSVVVRHRSTDAQSGLNAIQRKRNISNAFNVIYPLIGQKVAIVDDVVTTGYTVLELARQLKCHGAQSVDVWCCARQNRADIALT